MNMVVLMKFSCHSKTDLRFKGNIFGDLRRHSPRCFLAAQALAVVVTASYSDKRLSLQAEPAE